MEKSSPSFLLEENRIEFERTKRKAQCHEDVPSRDGQDRQVLLIKHKTDAINTNQDHDHYFVGNWFGIEHKAC
jgi:hypothetical protein